MILLFIAIPFFFLACGCVRKKKRNHYHPKFSKEELFEGQKYRREEDQKPWPGLALNQDFAKGRGLKSTVKK